MRVRAQDTRFRVLLGYGKVDGVFGKRQQLMTIHNFLGDLRWPQPPSVASCRYPPWPAPLLGNPFDNPALALPAREIHSMARSISVPAEAPVSRFAL
jgi:hypothetical protein